ncbi:acyltransferase family protein [Pseudescherichia vulneris]|uniref:acyltransferase n=1 Tax=Pseudescherichia vulneris TaxID=566 RepID=UPI0028D7166C|nr:acyltransferase family protein [Pseudescherichia vulneris]
MIALISNRIINIEILRALAIVSVILIHMSMGHFYDLNLMSNDFFAWVTNNIYYTLTRFCVPVFFIIAAYIAYNNKSSSTWTDKLIRIGLPYVVWSGVYYYYQGGTSIIELVNKIFTSNPSFHLWFLPPFLGFVILLPAIKKIFTFDEDRKQFKHVFLLLFLFSIIMPSIIVLLNYIYGGYDFLYGLGNFGFTISGLLIFSFAFPFMYKKISPGLGLCAYLVITLVNLLLNVAISRTLATPNEYFYGYSTPLVFISSFILFNSIMSIDFSFLPDWVSRVVYKVGSCSFGIYLVHWLVYGLMDRYGLVLHGRAIMDPLINTGIVFTVSFLCIIAVRRFKPLRYIC